ncbi:MAG: hypothetical protein ABJV04_13215 [Aliiglaciecola sp.]|uniref:hypothetical protein n=1 Tax=Aliiglaciecola sp. TaxID=1872441 RepID=UPI00329839EF
MNEFDKSYKKDVSAVNKRRNFLKKSATGAVIVSLPAKSVWGACSVSGALSGNLSTNTDRHTCTMPYLNGGRSPGNWKKYSNNMHSTFTKLKTCKNNYGKNSSEYKTMESCYAESIEEVYQHTLTLPSDLPSRTLTVSEALASNGSGDNNIYFHLAAVYLNTYFGFYSTYTEGAAAAQQAISEVFLYWYISKNSSSFSGISESELGYDEGSTDWSPVVC